MDRLRQRAYADFLLPPTERGYDSFGVLADRSDIQGLEVTRYALGATRLQERKGAGDSRVEYETRGACCWRRITSGSRTATNTRCRPPRPPLNGCAVTWTVSTTRAKAT